MCLERPKPQLVARIPSDEVREEQMRQVFLAQCKSPPGTLSRVLTEKFLRGFEQS